MNRVSIRVPLDRAEEARAEWIERFPEGFEEREEAGELELAAYTNAVEFPGARVEPVQDGWEERWRDFHRPVRIGTLWIGPPWLEPAADSRAVVVDPGRAFGTGAHATTRLAVELLTTLPPASLLDVGTGSGVISIAAALLGFHPVVAVDVDPAAVDAAKRNAAVNGVELDVRLLDAASDPLPPAEVAVANISLETVDAVLERVDARFVVTSGYLERDLPSSSRHSRRRRVTLEGWAADLLERAE